MAWLGRKLWPWLISAASITALLFTVRQSGRLKEKQQAAQKAAARQRRMRDAGSRVFTDRRSIVKRLRGGNF